MTIKNLRYIVLFFLIITPFLINGCGTEDNFSPTRHIELEGQNNFRDLGGYTTSYGKTIRWRILFRSGDLSGLTDADLLIVNNLGLKLVIDFRSKSERDKSPDKPLAAPTKTLFDAIAVKAVSELMLHVLKTGDTSELTVDHMADLYRNIYTDNPDQFKLMLYEVINSENRPVLIHCSGGNDRTGFGAALILSSLQVPYEIILEDYLLSNEYFDQEKLLERFKKEIVDSGNPPPTEEDMERIRDCFVEVKKEYLESAFQSVLDVYGTFGDYIINGLDIPKSDIDDFRSQVLVSQ